MELISHRQKTKFKLFGNIFLVAVVSVLMLAAYSMLVVHPSFTALVIENTEKEAEKVAAHLSVMLLPGLKEFQADSITEAFHNGVDEVMRDFGLLKLKLFSPTGEIVYSTDRKEVGQVNRKSYFREIVAKGNKYSKVVKKGTRTLEDQTVVADVVETYVPIMRDGKFVGAFEIYYDITERKEKLDRTAFLCYSALFALSFVLLSAVLVSSYKTSKAHDVLRRQEEQLIRQSGELKEMNKELSVLQEVATSVSRTIEMDELFKATLDTIARLEIFNVKRESAIFLVENNSVRLAYQIGCTEGFVKAHETIAAGKCLCSIAARTGEVIVSSNSETDERHAIVYPGMIPHGHIIVPLKAKNRVVGVMCLYTETDAEVGESKLKLLTSIGNQIGVAIENARLYEETKSLSMHDPLTGLANRRMMDVVLARKMAEATRYDKPLSMVMLDIDHFKKFNDTYGHDAGDRLLRDIAGIIRGTSRDADLAARYGGEEFLVILPETDAEGARTYAERLRRLVAEKTPVTISLGVSTFRKGIGQQELIKEADSALYRAKEKGRNRTEVSA